MIYLGADHRGFELKQRLLQRLEDEGYQVKDLGDQRLVPGDDYVDFAKSVAEAVTQNPNGFGILLCGSGAGVDIVANKFAGIRSALAFDEARARQAREHEDANVLSLPADTLDEETAWQMVQTFLKTPFSGEKRHQKRLEKIAEIEQSNE